MSYILLLLLLFSPVHATSDHPLDRLTNKDLCDAVMIELQSAVEAKLITQNEAIAIALRCLNNS